MIIEFFIAFVKTIGGSKKCDRIGDMNGYRHIQLPTGVPHGIKSRIVNLDECSGSDIFAKVESKRFENF